VPIFIATYVVTIIIIIIIIKGFSTHTYSHIVKGIMKGECVLKAMLD